MKTRQRYSRGAPRGRGSFRSRKHTSRGGNRGGGRKIPTFDPSKFVNTNPAQKVEEVYSPKHTFETLGLSPDTVQAVHAMGITVPSPIQDQIIPHILRGRDVIGLAETGTGKTAAFLIPLIERLRKRTEKQVLVLTPTRELALQIEQEFIKLTKGMNMRSVTCVGGTNIRPQIKALKGRNDIVVGTPGRIKDLLDRRVLRMDHMSAIVLDEADRMLDMGFIHDMRYILKEAPDERRTLFFSATLDKTTEKLVGEFLKDPITVSVKKKDVTDSIVQDIVTYESDKKFDTLLTLLGKQEYRRVIIFGAMKHSVERLAKDLAQFGVTAESIHGNKSHGQRQRSLNKFKSGNARVLVATDVAARGIHVDNVSHVINYDLPQTFEDYVHRIGRTGRGEQKGIALTFVQKRNR